MTIIFRTLVRKKQKTIKNIYFGSLPIRHTIAYAEYLCKMPHPALLADVSREYFLGSSS